MTSRIPSFCIMVAAKHKAGDENSPLVFSNLSGPYVKHIQCVFKPESKVDFLDIQNQCVAHEANMAETWKATEEAAICEAEVQTMKQITHVLAAVSETGYRSLAKFLTDLMTTKDQVQSSQVSKMLIQHGDNFLDLIREQQLSMASGWALRVSGEIIGKEAKKLADYFRPEQGQEVSEVLANFSLDRILSDAEEMAPNFCELL
jgi:hypothetical protein